MDTTLNKAATLRRLLARDDMLVVPGCYDPFGARIIEELGFPAVYVGGFATGAHLVHTEPLLQINDQVEAAERIDKVVDIPVIADAHSGWGEPLHAMRAVREFEHARIAAFHIEDQVVPKRASYFRNIMHILPRDEFIAKMKYALDARRNKDTILIGRTDAFSALEGSRDERAKETIARAQAMVEIGIEYVFLRGVTEIEDMKYFRKALPALKQITITHGDIDADVYRQLGYKALFYPTAPVVVTYDAMKTLYSTLKETGRTTYTPKRYWQLRKEIFTTLKQEEMWKVESETVEKGNEPRTAFIPEVKEG